ncbi:MAG TPA: DUF2723 domain-containing protein, partial [Kofleriaceae bacterium]|nr:DUF2723 domain-containing protein [Kofleriaceae bacterium]
MAGRGYVPLARLSTPPAIDATGRWTPRVLAVLAFGLYALAAPGGPYWLDSGELSAAGVALGIGHPTGFPLHMALLKLASLLPLGELAFRANLLSAACAALAVLWVARLVIETAEGQPGVRREAPRDPRLSGSGYSAVVGAVAAGAALGLSLTFFRQATVAEVYAPNAALLALALLLGQRVAAGGGARAGLALALVCGLGLGVHVTFALVGAPLVVLYLLRLRRGARWTVVAPLVVALGAGGL